LFENLDDGSGFELTSMIANSYTDSDKDEFVPLEVLQELSASLATPTAFQLLLVQWMETLLGIENPLSLLLPDELIEAQIDYFAYLESRESSEEPVPQNLIEDLKDGEIQLLRGATNLMLILNDPNSGELDSNARLIWQNMGDFLTFIVEHAAHDLNGQNRPSDRAWSAGATESTFSEEEPETNTVVEDGTNLTFEYLGETLAGSVKGYEKSPFSSQEKEDLISKVEESIRNQMAIQQALLAKEEAKKKRLAKRDALRARTLELSNKIRAKKVSNLISRPTFELIRSSKPSSGKFGLIAV
jgi:hypothetical protein